jgi:uncharacterized repeat protein (TIGR01451 family)
MTRSNTHISGLIVLAATAWVGTAPLAFAQDDLAARNFGSEVVNIATMTYTSGGNTATFDTDAAVFVIRPPQTPAVIEFFRHSPTAADPIFRSVNGSDYSPNGELDGPFTSTGAPVTTGLQTVDLSSEIPLIPASTYLAGELMFVRVTDVGQNLDSTEIETVVITISADNGDTITMRLYESSADSGEFFAYLPSTVGPSDPNDNKITAGGNTQLTATYFNLTDRTNVTVDTAVLNPLNRVFSSVDGTSVDEAIVTLVNIDTGERAQVFGVDGFSLFPSIVTSGEDSVDTAGLVYENDIGEFRFPIVQPGNYRIEVEPPEGFTFSTVVDEENLSTLSRSKGFVLTPGSLGAPFTVSEAGPLRFDIPLDPKSNLVVTKAADRTTADVGDYINYTVTVRNAGFALAPIRLYDTLPIGFRYVPGTARIESAAAKDPVVSDDATLLTFDMDLLAPGETFSLTYALAVGPGAHLGDAVNEAVVRDAVFNPVSNTARAGVRLREDLLRSTSTIIGRVTEQSCDGDADWARPIDQGIGVDGVRLYMETGAYAVSDANGLYHFEGVSEGTHVVQVDEETLPKGFELMTCEESTRYAGAMNSKFIDVQGGGIWRANFYLKQTGETEEVAEAAEVIETTEHLKYDVDWLNTQDSTAKWAYPEKGRTPSSPSTHLGIKHAAGQTVSIRLNDSEIEGYYFQGRDSSTDNRVQISRWRGLPLQDGRNVVLADIHDANGTKVDTIREEIWYVKTIARATPLPDQSVLVADGRTTPVIAIRMEDQSGRPVHAGRITTINLEAPYSLNDEDGDFRLREQTQELIAPLSNRREFSVGPDGILKVPLEPTLRTGKVTVIATLDNGREIPVYMYLEPEKRDWILVGLAEGSAALQDVKGNLNAFASDADDVVTDGRVAFFAKGLIKGNWLMTLAVDTDKRRGSQDGEFSGEIDPNAYYTLYGDQTYQQFEGVSRYPLFVKLEKRQAYALFGDFDTDITEGRLTSYNRKLTGLKAEYLGDNLQVLGFAAETNQGFMKDEIAAEGLSGPYQLSHDRVLPQSEEIVVETRDRLRPDIILERKTLVRYLDYTLDYFTGKLIFRLPVDATDSDFNPNVIVVDYESSEDAERNITAGGRVQAQFLNDKLQVGSTFTHENGSSIAAGSKSNQIGIDVIAKLSDTTELRAEYAVTDQSGDGEGVADAKLLELIHTSEKVLAEAYFREEDGNFGLNQTGSNTNGVRRYGARGEVNVQELIEEDTGRRATRKLKAQVSREENLSNNNRRTTGELLAAQEGTKLDASAGLRFTRDELVDADNRTSLLAVARASYDIGRHGISVQAAAETPISGKDEVSGQPQRLMLGVDKRVGSVAVINLRHELLNGAGQDSANTTLGVSATPWTGGTATIAADNVTNDSGKRLGGTVGLDQTVRLTEHVSAQVGVRARRLISEEDSFIQVTPDDAISPFEVNEDFQSIYVGAAYNNDVMTASSRIEVRDSSEDQTWVFAGSAARELSDTLSLAASARGRISAATGARGTDKRYEARVGAAWRPRNEDTVFFNRLDVVNSQPLNDINTTKLVNNAAMNTMISDRWQLSTNVGTKYVKTEIEDKSLSNWTHLIGAETRFDVTERIDVGLRGALLTSKGSGTSYSWGPSVGVSPVDNVWISAGYNVEGFKDRDFEAAEYARKGAYLQLRVKFDQDTARGLLRRISPTGESVGPRQKHQILSAPSVERIHAAVTVSPVSVAVVEPVSAAPVSIAVAEPVLAPVVEPDYELAPTLVIAPTPVFEAAAAQTNLNFCDKSSVAIFDVPIDMTPKTIARLGTMPEFGESHGLTPLQFYDKLNARYYDNAVDQTYLDYLFKSMGYANGWADAQPYMFSDDVLPVGTSGLMGFGKQHHLQYSILPAIEADREAFRIQSVNGTVVHFMKTCGNYMYACE